MIPPSTRYKINDVFRDVCGVVGDFGSVDQSLDSWQHSTTQRSMHLDDRKLAGVQDIHK